MTLRVPGIPPRIVDAAGAGPGGGNTMRAAHPVRGYGQWYEMARADNWLLGVGGSLAFCGDSGAVITAGNSAMRRFWVWPRSQHGSWLWSVGLCVDRATGAGNGAYGFVTLNPGGKIFDFIIPPDVSAAGNNPERATLFRWVHEPSSTSEGEVSIQVTVNSFSPESVVIQSVGIYELPRVVLSSASAGVGVRESTCTKGHAIYNNNVTLDKFSAQAVYGQSITAKNNVRRQAIFNFYNPSGVTATTTAFAGANVLEIAPAFQTRHLDVTGTTRNIKWNAYALVTGASAVGEVRVSMSSGATSTITVTSTTATWHTAATFAVETDDFTSSDTIRGGTRDAATFEIRRTAGTSITLYGISVGEAPA